MSSRTEAPFRADHVEPPAHGAVEGRAHEEEGEITPLELRAIEDEEILTIVRSRKRSD